MKLIVILNINISVWDKKNEIIVYKIQCWFYLLAFYDNLEVEKSWRSSKTFIFATSDCGFCGAANSSILQNIHTQLQDDKQNVDGTKIIAIKDKFRIGVAQTYSSNLLLLVNEIGERSLVFNDASAIAQQLLNFGFEYVSTDDNVLCSFREFNSASVLFYSMKENAPSK
jgi:F0F1-type ATP synthase gamma subunit